MTIDDWLQSPNAALIHGSVGPQEIETREALKELAANGAFSGASRTTAQLAISLAMSIDRGNAKGRAIANEAAQLFQMMAQLAPPEAAGVTDSNLTDETRRLLDAFEAPATHSPSPESD